MLSTNSFIFRTPDDGVKLLRVKELATKQFSVHHLLDDKNGGFYSTKEIDLQVTRSSLIIAAYYEIWKINIKHRIKLIKLDLAGK